MPAKNSQKLYVEDAFYHLYNRGVEKRIIFSEAVDYGVFLSYLKEYLSPKPEQILQKQLLDPTVSPQIKDSIIKALQRNNFFKEITLLAYCLMPNHFHLLVRQKHPKSIDLFMNSLLTRYSMYFNRKNKRVGPLYQGVYKAVLVFSEEHLLHLSRYIHRNPLFLQGVTLQTLSEQHSSYSEYLGKRKTAWVHQEQVLSFFKNGRFSYESFIMEADDIEKIEGLVIDDADS